MKFIAESQFKEENLHWWRPVQDGNKISYEAIEPGDVPFHEGRKIVDAEGVVYDAILAEDGTVFDDWTRYDSADSFERLRRGGERRQQLVTIAETSQGRYHYTLFRDKETDEFFAHSYHSRVYPSNHIMSVNSAHHLADWLLDLHEQQTITFPQTLHIAVSLPADLIDRIERVALLEGRSTRDWIFERLNGCIQDERSAATLAAEEERAKQVAAELAVLQDRAISDTTAPALEPIGEARRP
jgi:hypothetical protein